MINIEYASDIAKRISRQRDDQLLKQLNWLVSRGLLVIERYDNFNLTTFPDPNGGYKILYSEDFQLVVKDKEYIERLEKELEKLRKIEKVLGELK